MATVSQEAAADEASKLGINVDELITRFSALDYAVFGLLLAVSLAIGIYFGLCKRHEMTDAAGYLLGGRNMGTLPAAMSLIASFMSAITLLGTPAEVYQYGTQYFIIGISYLLVMPATAYLYMPIFYDLRLISVYEYLEKRFHRMVRILGAILFCIQMNIYMAIVVYAPSLALSQVTGVNVYLSVCLIFFVCIFYTALGGMKAVLWTDTIQMIIMFGAMLAIIIKGSLDVGGFSDVWTTAEQGGRIEFFNFNPSPGVRHTVWTLVVGGYFTWVTIYGVNQAQVQRYLCVPSRQRAANAIWVNLIGLLFLLTVCSYAGLVIYAKYRLCDPITSGSVSKPDQLFPLFVMDTMGEIPGVPGLFVAGIFSGALSTVSSGINSLAAITLEDFIIPNRKQPLSHQKQALITQVLAVAFGILGFVLVFVAEQLGDILQAALSLYGMVGGPLLGVFTLGMFFPWANFKGAMSGVISALVVIFWIGVGFQVEKAYGRIHIPKLPTSIDGCPRYNVSDAGLLSAVTSAAPNVTLTAPDITVTPPVTAEPEDAAGVYYMSYMWYSTVASTVVVVVGMLVSLATGPQDPRLLDPRLVIPLGDKLRFLPDRWRTFLNFDVGRDYRQSEKASEMETKGRRDMGHFNEAATDDGTRDAGHFNEAATVE